MAFEEVQAGQAIDIKKEKGKAYVGTYVGSRQIQTKIGTQTIWEFEGDTENFGIYGFTHLNIKMERVKPHTLCRITYLGTKNMKTKFGMKDVHQAKVETDKNVPEEEGEQAPF